MKLILLIPFSSKLTFCFVFFPVIVRLNHKDLTDKTFKSTVTNWLRNSSQRIRSEQKKAAKEAEEAEDAEDLNNLTG